MRLTTLNLLFFLRLMGSEDLTLPARVGVGFGSGWYPMFAVRQGGEIWPHTGSLALPVRVGRRLLGCINTVWMARVINAEEGVSRCVEPLRETRQLIEQKLAEARDG
jgi:IclR family mhp operon transcriptional activator